MGTVHCSLEDAGIPMEKLLIRVVDSPSPPPAHPPSPQLTGMDLDGCPFLESAKRKRKPATLFDI
eukprot:m.365632 g.365632  ORF g.365632 m.365632 type:complete len:65 (+) comp16656_c0_seq21:2359-2553(+)